MSNFEDWEGGWMGVLFVSAMKSEFEPRSTDRKFWKENVHREIYRLLSVAESGENDPGLQRCTLKVRK